MSYIFEMGEKGDVLRIGKTTISIEYNGDGPHWRTLPNGELDPIYPYFHVREIEELSNNDIEQIGEQIKRHLKLRRGFKDSTFPQSVFSGLDPNHVKEVE